MNKEQKKPQEDWEEWITVLMQDNPYDRMQAMMNGGYPISKESKVINYIKHNFIAKRDLRKLLEGKKKQLSQYDDEKELHDDAWNYNLTIDDILAESEKL